MKEQHLPGITRRNLLQETLDELELPGRVVGVHIGASVSRFEVEIAPGVRICRFEKAAPEIAERFSVPAVRVALPIPWNRRLGIEIPNEHRREVGLCEVLAASARRCGKLKLPVVLGADVKNKPVVFDLAAAPHVLVAGADENEKDACLDTMIAGLIHRFGPDELKFIMIDSRRGNLEKYGALPHLLPPINVGSADAPATLRWIADEIDRRYRTCLRYRVKTLHELLRLSPETEEVDKGPKRLPYLVVVVDELAELMAGKDKRKIESELCRIAMKGRAAGIHLVVGTSQFSPRSITGFIKACLPTRICFKADSDADSSRVLDRRDAALLTGSGDLLLDPIDGTGPIRVQCATVPTLESGGMMPLLDRCPEPMKLEQLP